MPFRFFLICVICEICGWILFFPQGKGHEGGGTLQLSSLPVSKGRRLRVMCPIEKWPTHFAFPVSFDPLDCQ